ncbi:hypothetical protein [Lentzea nigeriaca]|uniref:hypothetical protein n=1 Tax=Lentzea nigeriaca TaxID=1128665 RepID=UPI0019595C19|nr:hypothetical protein [Lentzea nigeriaca]MBM7863861.1 hypothetical protein [Lentzea nigeriaca]
MPKFAHFSLDGVRRLSSVAEFSVTDPAVTLIRVDRLGVVHQARTAVEKRAMLTAASDGDLVLAGGREVVAVDDLPAARAQACRTAVFSNIR